MEDREAEQACQDVNRAQQTDRSQLGALTPYGYKSNLLGGAAPMTEAEHRKRQRDAEAQQAIYILEQARQIRANADLMVAVRAHIRKLRDDGAALLDDIGG